MQMMPLLLFAATLIGMVALAAAALSGPSAAKAQIRRIDALKARHTGGGGHVVEAQMRRILAQRETRLDSAMARFIPNPKLLAARIERTGLNWTLGKYALISFGLVAIVTLGLLLRGAPVLLSLFAGLAIGLGLPHMLVSKMIKRRVDQFTSKFPDAIELLVRGLRSGLPISETIGVVASEVPGPVGFEFRGVADKMKIGRTMDQALQETADRLNTAEFQFFCITLAIQRETGGNLAETLSNLADVLRKRAQMKLKIAAMSSESKASAYIIGVLPFLVFLMIMWVNYDYMSKFFTDERLMVAGLGGLIWMGIGAFIMKQMINFEI
jgi:tight adherence protein B